MIREIILGALLFLLIGCNKEIKKEPTELIIEIPYWNNDTNILYMNNALFYLNESRIECLNESETAFINTDVIGNLIGFGCNYQEEGVMVIEV